MACCGDSPQCHMQGRVNEVKNLHKVAAVTMVAGGLALAGAGAASATSG
ncbi:MAG: hypothetical protein QOF44_115, partial [Streptomyces sp.]|nr:hypothetical protein [Streptomyces sp.]